jgi:L-aminopeptidase/D-esterase-like protein
VVAFERPINVACVSLGGAATTYNTESLKLDKNYYQKHAIFMTDGAMSGLEASYWIAKGLREKNVGWKMGKTINPSMTGVCIMGFENSRFDPELGYRAVISLSKNTVESGNVGVGIGAGVGKFSWTDSGKCLGMKGGIGSAKIDLGKGAVVCALTVVNALGNVVDKNGEIMAGNRNDNKDGGFKFRTFEGLSKWAIENQNTTISVVGTNIKLPLLQQDLTKVAQIATHGQIRAIKPVNTSLDGDTVFAFSTQEIDIEGINFGDEWWKLSADIVGQAAADAVQESIYDACKSAKTVKWGKGYQGIIPAIGDY